ncbi:MAG: hypothetical protein U0790_11705 [Isosphaeraceae bacterium]
MKTCVAMAVTLAALALAGPSRAGTLTYTGTFDVDFASDNPITNFSGSFSFQFDESAVLGIGNETFFPTLGSLTLNPASIGSTTFTTANVGVVLYYLNGVLTFANLYGTVGGTGVSLASNDFYVSFSGPDLGSAAFSSSLRHRGRHRVLLQQGRDREHHRGRGPRAVVLALAGVAGVVLAAGIAARAPSGGLSPSLSSRRVDGAQPPKRKFRNVPGGSLQTCKSPGATLLLVLLGPRGVRGFRVGGPRRPSPSPRFSGERAGVRGPRCEPRPARPHPAPVPPSPARAGEGMW